ncbi:MAG: ion channel [Scytonema sp. PMC 1069.18]|nr:ion channel [Scytonema sp. PMC 1069.18]MEC4882530.1 ion channel [Scytonema sp. PMC 1070.18]
MNNQSSTEKQVFHQERYEILQQIEDWLEVPMLVLSFAWLGLFIVEVTQGLSPLLQIVSNSIWFLFILDFIIEFTIVPRKLRYIKTNWLTAIALILPALRLFRLAYIVRLLHTARAARGLQLLRVITRTNQGMRALGASFNRRGFGYVVLLSLIVTLIGAAGMYAFENLPEGNGLNSYGVALWWTAMIMTTMGSEYWPQTPEGRVLCFILALYSSAVFGYVTAVLATFFIGRDAEDEEAEIAGTKSLEALRHEISQLRADIQALAHQSRDFS